MRIALSQTFPLGRFHATPWRVSPYDDPYGEWPPSPWRLLRAVLARSHQLERERPPVVQAEREALVQAFASSQIAWHLPPLSWRGPGLCQYQPADFKGAGKAVKATGYTRTKVRDNFRVVGAPGAERTALFWFLTGDRWEAGALQLLQDCLARMTYFGRSESLTEITILPDAASLPAPNCQATTEPGPETVPVLGVEPGATLNQVQATVGELAGTTLPPGSRWYYASRPERPAAHAAKRLKPAPHETDLIQFAVAGRLLPAVRDTVRLTQRFRGRALRAWLRIESGGAVTDWRDAPATMRARASWLSGKDAFGQPLVDHSQAVVFLEFEQERAARLCVWRRDPLGEVEQAALLAAADLPLPLNFRGDPWTVSLIPLSSADRPTALPSAPSSRWAARAFVPPRHILDRRGRARPGQSVCDQLRVELARRGFDSVDVQIASQPSGWVRVHLPMRDGRSGFSADKRAYQVELLFPGPVAGPIFLGSSSHFGLGVFTPDR